MTRSELRFHVILVAENSIEGYQVRSDTHFISVTARIGVEKGRYGLNERRGYSTGETVLRMRKGCLTKDAGGKDFAVLVLIITRCCPIRLSNKPTNVADG